MIFSYSGSMQFVIKGTRFPFVGASSSNEGLGLVGSKPFFVTIDYGDSAGAVKYDALLFAGIYRVRLLDYDNVNVNPALGNYAGKLLDNRNDRLIRITCSNWSVIIQLVFNNLPFSKEQVLGMPFNLMTGLVSINNNFSASQASYGFITEVNKSLFSLNKLNTFVVSLGMFSPSSRYYGYIQPDMLNRNITTIGFDSYGFPGKSFIQTNLVGINASSMPNLKTLGLGGLGQYYYDDNSGAGPFPVQWTRLPALNALQFDRPLFTRIPDRYNDMASPTFSTIRLTGAQTVVAWPVSLANLTELTLVEVAGANRFTSDVPAYLSANKKLRTVAFTNAANAATQPVGWIDALIDNWYNFIVANASLASGSSPFRGMIMNYAVSGGVAGQVPSGVYKAPEGFVVGVSNGVPSNAQEKLYVMQVQYAHVWTVPS